jgi:hypothetical protein
MTSIVDFSITIWVVVIPIALLGGFFFNWRKSAVTSALLCVTASFFLIIQPNLRVSVVGASKSDWNPKSFWYEPWGASVVHRGIDIFAKAGTEVVAPSGVFVIYSGKNPVIRCRWMGAVHCNNSRHTTTT